MPAMARRSLALERVRRAGLRPPSRGAVVSIARCSSPLGTPSDKGQEVHMPIPAHSTNNYNNLMHIYIFIAASEAE